MCHQSVNLEAISAGELWREGEQLVYCSFWIRNIIRRWTCQYGSFSDFLSCGREGVDTSAGIAIVVGWIVAGETYGTGFRFMVKKLTPEPAADVRSSWHKGAMSLSIGDVTERCDIFLLAPRN